MRYANVYIARGKIVRGPCERTKEGTCLGSIQAHHEDYSKPLTIRWLCQHHNLERQGKTLHKTV